MGENEGPQCASHRDRQWKWNINKSKFDWHKLMPFSDNPKMRWALLIILAVVVIAVIVVGIVVTAEYYATYYASGAWLLQKGKNGTGNGAQQIATGLLEKTPPTLLQPEVDGLDENEEHPRLYICGASACGEFNQPHICCAVGTTCYGMPKISNSGVLCCVSELECKDSNTRVGECLQSTTQCDKEQGGGCCPPGTTCANDGCIKEDSSQSPPSKTSVFKIGEVPGTAKTESPQTESQSSPPKTETQSPGPEKTGSPKTGGQSIGVKTVIEWTVFDGLILYAWAMAFFL